MRSKEASRVSTSRCSPVQLLGDQQPVGRVVLAEREVIDAALTLPIGKAAPQVALDAGRGLVALLGRLGEQLHDDRGDRVRDSLQPLAGRERLSRDMAVDPLHGIGRGERQRAREHLIERDAERIEVAARIDRAVHPSGLFGRHVGERAGDGFGRLEASVVRAAAARRCRSRSAGPVRRRSSPGYGRASGPCGRGRAGGPCPGPRRCRSRGARSAPPPWARRAAERAVRRPESSSTSMVRPRSRTSSNGRTAQAPSSSSFNSYSCARRSRIKGGGCSAVTSSDSTVFRPPSAPGHDPRQKVRSPSSHKTCRLSSIGAAR